MEAEIRVSSWWAIVPNGGMRVLSDHLSQELPLNTVWWPAFWTFVSCFFFFTVFLIQCTLNSKMIAQLGGGVSSNGLIFLAIFATTLQLSDFLFSFFLRKAKNTRGSLSCSGPVSESQKYRNPGWESYGSQGLNTQPSIWFTVYTLRQGSWVVVV